MPRDPTQRVRNAIGTVSVAELLPRCAILEPGIVLQREPPHNTLDTYDVLVERVFELAKDFDRWALVVDLSEVTERPKGRYLERIRERALSDLDTPGHPIHLAITQPGSIFLRTVLGFVLGRMSRHTSVHPTREAAISACRNALAAREEHLRNA